MTLHTLEPTPETVVEVFDRDVAPVLTIDPGDALRVRTLDASGYLSPQRFPGDRPPRMFTPSRGHCLAGPIAVRGAEPGSVLAVTVVSLRPDSWGWTVAGGLDNVLNRSVGVVDAEPSWLLWDLDAEQRVGTTSTGFRRPLAPFLGVIGVAPAEAGEHSTVPPRAQGGGNLDCRELVAGSTLYLPVLVPGALLSVGDGHAAQGDGEVGGTAIECGMTTELVVDVVPPLPVAGICAVTPTARITFGFDADLNTASGQALSAMLTWMSASYGLDRATALALASAAVDLRVTQVANTTWGVHAVLEHDALAAPAG